MRTAPLSRALVAAFLSLAPAAAWSAADLGTLFFSAEERDRLDRLRRGEPEVGRYARTGPPVITGYVKRSDGRNTVWIDGAPVPVSTPESARLLDSARPSQRSDESVKIERKPQR